MKYNENFEKLPKSYVFSQMAQKIADKKKRGGERIINLGIGDLKLPLFECSVNQMKIACEEMRIEKTFKGYPPAEGYEFLRQKISNEYIDNFISVAPDEVFITDGAKGQLGNILELFGQKSRVLFLTPCYPAGAEANILYGNEVTFLSGSQENGFFPSPPYGEKYDVIYICSPNNPTGSCMTYEKLGEWVNYALFSGSVIVYDNAYSVFVSGDFPKSVYSVKNANKCAIEINSFSKSFGFTGIRCGFTVIPKSVGEYNRLQKRWLGCRCNGVSYISQRGAEAVFSRIGREEVKRRVNFYKTNAEILKIALKNLKLWYNNTVHSPYVFAKTPHGVSSTEFCEYLLEKTSLAVTDGAGFLTGGEGYFRLSAFLPREDILETADRLERIDLGEIATQNR
ncbi:MAG: LL-diaminopimelate aminotransferase [Clostridiales bacterium]|nr:LL-diaminopimelate aminotransferase [Clostridiales bacterium]